MKRRSSAFVLAALAALFTTGRARAAMPLDVRQIESAADAITKAQIDAGVAPGVTVAVAKDGEVVFIRGYGKADVQRNVATEPNTVYKIGSVTKQFTAAVIMRLV